MRTSRRMAWISSRPNIFLEHSWKIIGLFTIVLLISLCSDIDARRLSSRVVTTKYGALRGFISSLMNRHLQPVEVFLGVPYASAPIGSLRFMPPVTPPHWRGIRMADHFGAVCPQRLPDITDEGEALKKMPQGRLNYLRRLLPFLGNQSEDCLYLNIYAPAVVGREPDKLPVMVFIHGESYDWNSGNPYDGSVLASFGGVVVVTINYRLGVLGFLPAFDGTARGNYGLMDQVAALHWIQENVAEFGGDPGNVTLFGQGHGAACVNLLMISPMAKGLFQRAIMQSGSAFTPWAIARDAPTHTRYLASVLDCPTRDNTALVECIRQRSITDIMRVQLSIPDHLTAFGPTIDGIVIPKEPAILMKSYKDLYSQYDLLFGLTKVESYFKFSAHEERFGIDAVRRDRIFRTLVRNVFTFHLQEIYLTILNEYTDWLHPEQHPQNIFETTVEALSDVLTVAPLLRAGNYHTLNHVTKARTFFYVFDHQTEESDYNPKLGCVTGEDLNYVFGAPLVAGLSHFVSNYTRLEYALSQTVMTYWTNFAKLGDPNEVFMDEEEEELDDSTRYDTVSWPPYDRLHQRYLSIGFKPKVRDHYHSHRLSFWLHLIPSLNRPGEGNLSYEHHKLDDHDDNRSYDGLVRRTPSGHDRVAFDDAYYYHPPPIPLPTVPSTSSVTPPQLALLPDEVPPNSAASSNSGMSPKDPEDMVANGTDVSYVTSDSSSNQGTTPGTSFGFLDMGVYSTALSVTIAVGCSLLILNVLIFAGVYYQRDKNRMEMAMHKANFQAQEQSLQSRLDVGGGSGDTGGSMGNPVPTHTTVTINAHQGKHPIRAPPPSPAGQYLQVQDFTYPTMTPGTGPHHHHHYMTNSLPPKGVVLGPAPNKVDPQAVPEAQPLLPQNPQGDAPRVQMSHLWAPPSQEISVSRNPEERRPYRLEASVFQQPG